MEGGGLRERGIGRERELTGRVPSRSRCLKKEKEETASATSDVHYLLTVCVCVRARACVRKCESAKVRECAPV